MNLHEYQAKEVFRTYGIPVPAGKVAASADEAVAAARALGGAVWVVKAQVHAGGRGKAGGVKVVRDADAVRAAAEGMLGTRLVTPQTGPEGLPVGRVYVESGSEIAREIYLSLTLNREKSRIALIASSAGGMDIEEVAHKTPEKILSVTIHPAAGLCGVPGARDRLWPGTHRHPDRRVPVVRQRALQALHREGPEPRRGESR